MYSLVDFSKVAAPLIDEAFFTSTSAQYNVMTPYAPAPFLNWAVNFNDASMINVFATVSVRCVY
jgi:hypothetical protein